MFDYVREAIEQADAEAAEYARWQEKRQLRLQSAEPARRERNSVSQQEMNLMVTRREIAQSEQAMRAHVQAQLEAFADMVGSELGQAERRVLLDQHHAVEIIGLRKRLAADDTVIDLPPLRQLRVIGGRDA
jgi:hypothetical protein